MALARFLIGVAAGVALLAFNACSSAKQQRPAVATDHRTIAEGYSLLYGVASQQKDTGKLLVVKEEPDAVDRFITELAGYASELSAELEDIAARYPALAVDTQFLPEVEVEARESRAAETRDALLSSSGTVFERRLLLAQLTALEYEQHIAKVMTGLEEVEERRAFWTRTEKRLGELRDKLERLLETRYFR
jgi:hypothetical protein